MRKPEPIAGDLVHIARTHGPDASCGGRVVDAAGDLLNVRIADALFLVDDVVKVQLVVLDDARYVMNGTVEDVREDRISVRALAPWSRLQQREFVRLRLGVTVWAEVENRTTRPATQATMHEFEAASGATSEGSAELGRWVELQARIVDLSAGGLQLETPGPAQLGDRLFVHFSLPDGEAIDTDATVVRCIPGKGGAFRLGLRFMRLQTRHESAIQRFILQQQALQRQRKII